jgi:hypothetical protein
LVECEFRKTACLVRVLLGYRDCGQVAQDYRFLLCRALGKVVEDVLERFSSPAGLAVGQQRVSLEPSQSYV